MKVTIKAFERLALIMLFVLIGQIILTLLFFLGSYFDLGEDTCFILEGLLNKLGWFCTIGGFICLIGLIVTYSKAQGSKLRYIAFCFLAIILGFLNPMVVNNLQGVFTKGFVL